MSTGLIYHERFLDHDTGPGHPERPERLRAIMDSLHARHLDDQMTSLEFAPAELSWVERIHTPTYVARLKAACEMGERHIDEHDSTIGPASYEIALLAAGGVLAAADAVATGRLNNAFCAVRPPGHHAEADRSMGFCLFNNVAIAAEYLIARHALQRVAIVDLDVHHGNGTQHIFEARRDVFFISLHEHPSYLYPGTGFASETGVGAGAGFTLNIPFTPPAGDVEYRQALQQRVLPALDRYQPQALIVSTGFDAIRGDPLAHMQVTPQCLEWMTRQLKHGAERWCAGRMISVLEGGYNLSNLRECAALHVGVLLEAEGHDGMMGMKAGF